MDEQTTSVMDTTDLLEKTIRELETQQQEINDTIKNLEEAQKTLLNGLKEVRDQINFTRGRAQEIKNILTYLQGIKYHNDIKRV